MLVAAVVFVPAGSSGVASRAPSPLLNPVLYSGTLRPASTCANPKSCTSFDVTFTNTGKVKLNSFLIGDNSDAFTRFRLNGEPACTSTGGKFGPNFKHAWLCLGLKIAPGATVTGSGIAANPLTSAATVRFDWSNKGSVGGMLPDYSQDIHYYPVAATTVASSKPHLESAEKHIEDAIGYEDKALQEGDSLTVIKAELHDAVDALDAAENDLKSARASGELDSGEIDSAIYRMGQFDVRDAGAADYQVMANFDTLKAMKEHLGHFLTLAHTDKEDALRVIKSALTP